MPRPTFRTAALLAVAAFALALLAYLIFVRWTPANAVTRSHKAFLDDLAQGSHRSYTKAIAPDYHDGWGLGHDDAVSSLLEVRRHFRTLTINWQPVHAGVAPRTATLTGHLEFAGEGSPVADVALRRAGRVTEPFTFIWARASWMPWDWKLTSVSHPTLEIPHDSTSDWGLEF